MRWTFNSSKLESSICLCQNRIHCNNFTRGGAGLTDLLIRRFHGRRSTYCDILVIL